MADLKHFRQWQKQHPNFVTPHIQSLRENGVYVVELSEGSDTENKPLYGVTVFKMCGSTYTNDFDKMNKMFRNIQEAKTHRDNVVKAITAIKKLGGQIS